MKVMTFPVLTLLAGASWVMDKMRSLVVLMVSLVMVKNPVSIASSPLALVPVAKTE